MVKIFSHSSMYEKQKLECRNSMSDENLEKPKTQKNEQFHEIVLTFRGKLLGFDRLFEVRVLNYCEVFSFPECGCGMVFRTLSECRRQLERAADASSGEDADAADGKVTPSNPSPALELEQNAERSFRPERQENSSRC
ncbi:hypothetical protein CDAR_13061 [Caerostris darwini]|uniref:Uncharacterized protein n=1 Tax=Caerostris darwini TaxID=1538125 RepID=A0AAV4Q4P0_9ARAC|nr:hypothetical protein CDAR_13061 [Caerostris darwini]